MARRALYLMMHVQANYFIICLDNSAELTTSKVKNDTKPTVYVGGKPWYAQVPNRIGLAWGQMIFGERNAVTVVCGVQTLSEAVASTGA